MSSSEIEFEKIGTYTSAFVSSVKVTKVSGGPNNFSALVYQCKFNVDWDGAPTCYGWNNPAEKNSLGGPNRQKNLKPIDGLRNATYPIKDANRHPIGLFHGSNDFDWVGLVSATREEAAKHKLVIDDRDELESLGPGTKNYPHHPGRFPVVQQSGDTAGYYVSQSGTAAKKGSRYEQSTYWDASSICYCVWPKKLKHNGIRLGDYGLVIRNKTGNSSGYFYGDTGSWDKLGESSGCLVETVSGSAKNNNDLVTFLAFPTSGPGHATEASEGQTDGVVEQRVVDLSGVDNAEDLITFIAGGADPDQWQKGYKSTQINSTVYENVRKALGEWGFQARRKSMAGR